VCDCLFVLVRLGVCVCLCVCVCSADPEFYITYFTG
jgi:hypothetical protein